MDDIVKEAREAFRVAEEASRDNHAAYKEDVKFARLSDQWPEEVLKERKNPPRPALTVNKLPTFIRQVVNDSRQNRPAISVHPVDDSGDPETADIMSGLIRNIEVSSNADVAYDTAIECAVGGGFGYWRINLEYSCDDTFDKDIVFDRIADPLSVFGDPNDFGADSADWNLAFVVTQIKKADFKRKYKGAQETDWDEATWQNLTAPWITDETIQVAEYWKRTEVEKRILGLTDGSIMAEDEYARLRDMLAAMEVPVFAVEGQSRVVRSYKVEQHIVSGAEPLEKVDWAGKYIPIVPVYGDEVIIEGRRHWRSLIRDAKDAQRMFNYWRTTATEMVALAPRVPYIGPKGAFKSDASKWTTANSSSHAFIEFDGPVPPQRQPFNGVPAGVIQEALNSSDDMKAVMGLYDASLGRQSNETSGKAIMARQREGDIATFHFIDNLTRAIRHSGKILIDLIPKVYTQDRVIRVLGPDMKPKTARIAGDVPPDPKAHIYDIAAGKYDLTVKAGPSFTSRREEAATQMIELMRAMPDAAPIIGDLLAKNLDWPGADEIAKRLEKMLPPGMKNEETGELPPEVQQQMQQMAEAIQVLGQKLQEAESGLVVDREKLKIDAAKVGVEQYKAETDRMQAVAPALSPEQVQAIVMQTIGDLLADAQLPEAEEGAMGPTAMMPEPDMVPAY